MKADSGPREEFLTRRLTTSNHSLRDAVNTSYKFGNTGGVGSQNSSSTSEERPKRDKFTFRICGLTVTLLVVSYKSADFTFSVTFS